MNLSYEYKEVVRYVSHYLKKGILNDAIELLDTGFYPYTYVFPNGLVVSIDFVLDVKSNIDFYLKKHS